MQGNLREIDTRSILQLIELGQRTGVLFVEIDGSGNSKKFDVGNALGSNASGAGCPQSWFVFFLNGQIIYATNGGYLSPLSDYLRHYRINVRLEDIQIAPLESANIPEYEYIWVLLQQNIINPVQARSIIQNLISEILFDLLSLYEGRFIFKPFPTLTPLLSAWEITPLVAKMTVQLQEWKQLYPFIQSPDRFPMLADITQLQSSLPRATLKKLQIWADGKTSLRQLSRYLNRSILTVAKAMYPYVQQGWVKFVCSVTNNDIVETQNSIPELEVNCKARVVCIDGERESAESVEFILRQQGYEAIALTDPVAALSQVFQLKPNLILCNTAMSPLDGYEICKMLRSSNAFRFLPIVLLVDPHEHHSHIKAKMMGATDCLTTPFGNTELSKLVERCMNYSVIEDNNRGKTLVDPIQYEVKNNITESPSPNKTSLSH